jgi:membrane protease YdiL (CAAX protease family)
VAHDGAWLVVVLVLFGLWLFVAIVAGLVLLIIFLIKWTNGTLPARFVRTPAEYGGDRGVWLETFAVFLGAFLLVHFVGGAIAGLAPKKAMWPMAVVLLMQWCLVGVIFWPRLRGMSWERFCGEIGWHRGRGVLREISAGVMGYLAGLPLYFLMALVVTLGTMLIEMIKHMAAGGKGTPEDMPLPDNKVFDMLEGSSGWMLFLLGTLIVVWAPLVEESIFRGALYRHLRQRLGGSLGMVISVGLVAAAFAAAHAYVLAGVIMVATLGAIFSVMREQRGSLIAPMTAHCMHNSMVMMLVLAILPVMRG